MSTPTGLAEALRVAQQALDKAKKETASRVKEVERLAAELAKERTFNVHRVVELRAALQGVPDKAILSVQMNDDTNEIVAQYYGEDGMGDPVEDWTFVVQED